MSLAPLNMLEAPNRVTVLDRPHVHVARAGLAVACLPWPRRAQLLAQLGRDVSHEQAGVVAQEALRDILRGLAHEVELTGLPSIGLCHVMIDGARTDHDQPIVGADMAVSLADLGLLRADYVACSHVHAQQDWQWNGAPIVYAGAPYHCNYGEAGPKGYVVVEYGDGGPPTWQRVATPCQPMVLLEYSWDGGAFMRGGHQLHEEERGAVEGGDIRLRYHVPADQRDAARAAAAEVRAGLLEAGAERVTVDECVLQTTTARDTTVAKAKTVGEKLTALWALRGDDVAPERRARVLGRLAELEVT
jgi:DNA repair exonuclease SbcCD nuclease subunit